jgi:ParB family transcriptional regulator, chromosome partitioning protein
MAKSGLGKGLGALISSRPALSAEATAGEKIHRVKHDQIVPSPMQPRREFAEEALGELVNSIRQHGIIQPLIVRSINGRYELIAGERRWRAAQELGLAELPVIIRTASDLEVLELSLIENLQRADLNPIEEAQGYARLAGEFSMRQEDIAVKVGRSRASVANAMRLLELHPQIQTWVAQNLISVGHAKVLLGLKAPEEQMLIAESVLRRNATVRQTERLVKHQLGTRRPRRGKNGSDGSFGSAAVTHLEERLQKHLGTRVHLRPGKKQGKIEIEYYGEADLQRILGLLGLGNED